MRKIFLVAMFGILCVAGCKKNDEYGYGKGPSTFPQLNGYYNNSSSILSRTLIIGENNILTVSDKKWNSKDEKWEPLNSVSKEWKVENNKFYMRYWDYNYATMTPILGDWEVYSFEFIDSDNFKLDDKLYTKE